VKWRRQSRSWFGLCEKKPGCYSERGGKLVQKGIVVYVEIRRDEPRKVSLELLSEGRRLADALGGGLTAVLCGKEVRSAAEKLGEYGADRILVVEHEALEHYSTDAYTAALTEALRKEEPWLVLLGATVMGKDLAPRVAARIGAGLATDCTGLSLGDDGGSLKASRPMYGGKVCADIEWLGEGPQMATVRANIFSLSEPESGRTAAVEAVDYTPPPEAGRTTFIDLIEIGGERIDVADAEVVVSGGRGMRGAENFKIIEELADLLAAAVGASRSAVDEGWRDHADQVGQTGKVISPNLYIACGISGAIQHLVGMSSSKCIVAVNKDPDAPIFKIADYGIVADLFDVVPSITEHLKQVLGE
jgi:electron transfer flavoprotein alpha subunit